MEMKGHVPTLAPGMDQVLEAGEHYTIKDDKGAEMGLTVRDRPWTIDFLIAFRRYMQIGNTLGVGGPSWEAAALDLKRKWEEMPSDLASSLPSVI